MRVLVLADTHAPRRFRTVPGALADALRAGPDLILHAGDVCTPAVLNALSQHAPVRVVLGNNDGPDVAAWGATHAWQGELGGVRVAMIHDSGDRAGRARRMRRRFPDADLLVFGHSHIPLDEADAETGLRLFNPGSAGDPRRQPYCTFGVLDLDDGRLVSSAIQRADG